MNIDEAKGLRVGQVLYHRSNRNADGTPQRWRVNGKVKTWERNPSKVKVPLKHGLRSFDYLTERELDVLCLSEEEALQLYKTDEECYAFCPDEKALEQFAKDGQWDSIEDLENETGVTRAEFIGKWFLIVHGRVFMR